MKRAGGAEMDGLGSFRALLPTLMGRLLSGRLRECDRALEVSLWLWRRVSEHQEAEPKEGSQ